MEQSPNGQIIQGKALVAFTDGACEPNPGHGAAAYILRDSAGGQLEARGFYLGDNTTNNVAEFEGVARAAEAAARHHATRLTIYSDSRMIVMQLQGRWRVKAEHLQDYYGRALDALGKLPRWSISWIPREQNYQADTVAGCAVRFRRDVDYGGREILQPASAQRGPTQPFRHARGSVYPTECFRTTTTRDTYREAIRTKQLKARNVQR